MGFGPSFLLSKLTMRVLRRLLLATWLLGELLSCVSSFQSPTKAKSSQRRTTRCHAAGDDQLFAAARARRDEERRRSERSSDVVVGQTSAKPGAKDLEINARVTEQEWLSQASETERLVYQFTDNGMTALKMMQIEAAMEAFERVFKLRPKTYLWQAGIAKFYLGDLKGAADIFARNAMKYETLFAEPASEERIWRNACLLKLYTTMSRAERKVLDQEGGGIKSLLPAMPDEDSTLESLTTERRKVMRIARDLFSASVNKDFVGVILSRARLRSIIGRLDQPAGFDRKMWKLSAWYYLGLHYDAIGELDESKRCMKAALTLCPSIGGNADDIIHSLPLIHMTRRDWFDEDDMTPDEPLAAAPQRTYLQSIQDKVVDPVLAESIEDSLSELRHGDLKEALKARGLLCNGLKEELQKRMFQVLIDEVTANL